MTTLVLIISGSLILSWTVLVEVKNYSGYAGNPYELLCEMIKKRSGIAGNIMLAISGVFLGFCVVNTLSAGIALGVIGVGLIFGKALPFGIMWWTVLVFLGGCWGILNESLGLVDQGEKSKSPPPVL